MALASNDCARAVRAQKESFIRLLMSARARVIWIVVSRMPHKQTAVAASQSSNNRQSKYIIWTRCVVYGEYPSDRLVRSRCTSTIFLSLNRKFVSLLRVVYIVSLLFQLIFVKCGNEQLSTSRRIYSCLCKCSSEQSSRRHPLHMRVSSFFHSHTLMAPSPKKNETDSPCHPNECLRSTRIETWSFDRAHYLHAFRYEIPLLIQNQMQM